MYYIYLLDVNDNIVNRIESFSITAAEKIARSSIKDCYRTVVVDKHGFETLEVYGDHVVYPASTTRLVIVSDALRSADTGEI